MEKTGSLPDVPSNQPGYLRPKRAIDTHRNDPTIARDAGGLSIKTTGFRPTCDHDAKSEPAIVLDPFAGSGTVGLVAIGNGRRFLGVDIKAEYLHMAEKRLFAIPNVRLDQF